MPILTMLVAVFIAVSTLNLILTLGVIRRIRQHTELLNEQRRKPVPSMGDMPTAFVAKTVAGSTVTRESLQTPALVGFFTTGCEPCETALPLFISYAATFHGGPKQVLAVVSGPQEEAAEYSLRLADVAQVVVENPDGPVQTAFSVDSSPAFGILDERGVVSVATRSVADLPASVAAR